MGENMSSHILNIKNLTMSFKKIIPLALVLFSLTIMSPVTASNATPGTKDIPKEQLAKQIESRLVEIKKMDKSNLSQAEKRELRKEVKDLKKQAKTNGIYLSVGAIIIIILLLILLL
jgi:biopolymer transport protein ExbD